MAGNPIETDAFKDYYQILHLHPDADAVMVDQAYWHLARLYNAAIPIDATVRTKLEELNEAYSVLRAPEVRKEYDKIRNAVLGVGALPLPPQPEPERLPLSVMERQRPRPRAAIPAAEHQPRPWRHRLRIAFQLFTLPAWQMGATTGVILALATAALISGTRPELAITLLVLGLAITTIPLLRSIRHLPTLPKPTLQLPSLRPPTFSHASPTHAADTDALRQSTQAILERWRANTGDPGASQPPPFPMPPPPPATDERGPADAR